MEDQYRLVLLGDAGVGKTALVIQLTLQNFDFEEKHNETIEDEYRKKLQIDGCCCLVTFHDTGGAEKYMDLRDRWIKGGDAFILVYSVSSRLSFTRIQSLHDHIQRESASRSAPQILIVANKTDQDRVISAEEGRVLAEQLGCQFVETSAKDCSNIEPAFGNLIQQIRRRKRRVPEMHRDKGSIWKWFRELWTSVIRVLS